MVHIRPFSDADVGPANALTNWYILHTSIHFAALPVRDDEFAAARAKADPRHPWLAAEAEGRFLGYAKAGVWRERQAYAGTCETGIYVVREHQGKGVGRALYAALLPALAEAGFHVAVAGITLPNEPSVRLHEAAGFRKVAHFHEVGRKFDRWHDVGFWQATLPAPATGE